mgnify:CR=1 FL=1
MLRLSVLALQCFGPRPIKIGFPKLRIEPDGLIELLYRLLVLTSLTVFDTSLVVVPAGGLTGKAGVCLATLGPGATNFVTAAAYAQLGAMPMLMISGQKPIMILARKSVANFKVREGAPSAFMVTLRRDRMWHFLDRLMNLAMPRIKDFRGVKTTAFDGAGNYAMGLNEQAVWPEINMARVNFTHGMHINICLSRLSLKALRNWVVFRNPKPRLLDDVFT